MMVPLVPATLQQISHFELDDKDVQGFFESQIGMEKKNPDDALHPLELGQRAW